MNRRELGSKYEKTARDILVQKGFSILEMNYHAGKMGEIDLIAQSPDGTLVFVECKARRTYAYGGPLSAVDARKKKQIAMAALYYYGEKGLPMTQPCRFDVFAFYPDGKMQHLENAFDMPSMGGF